MKKKNNHQNLESSTANSRAMPVILKDKFGIKPVVYIPVLYACVLLIIVIVIIVIQFRQGGEFIAVQSVPNGAAVYVDDNYVGKTPLKTFQIHGSHNLVISLPYYSILEEKFIAKKKILFRRFFPKTFNTVLLPKTIHTNTRLLPPTTSLPYFFPFDNSKENLIANTISQISSWNTSNAQTGRYIIPPILEQNLDNIAISETQILAEMTNSLNTIDYANIENLMYITQSILYESLPYLANTAPLPNTAAFQFSPQLQYWITTYESLQKKPSYLQFIKTYQNKEEVLYKNRQLNNFYQVVSVKKIIHTWKISTSNITSSAPFTDKNNKHTHKTILGLEFAKVPSQTVYYAQKSLQQVAPLDPIHYYMEVINNDERKNIVDFSKDNAILEIEVPAFYIMTGEITQENFAEFLFNVNLSIEEWKEMSKIHVSLDHIQNHFLDYNPNAYPTRPLRYITWYDAKAYTNWLNNKMQSLGYYAAMPNEYQWQAATLTYPEKGTLNQYPNYIPRTPSSKKPVLLGNLWEWGNSWYSPSPQYSNFDGPLYGSEKHIFGGSYVTQSNIQVEEIPIYRSRNTAYIPRWATAYVGFRIIVYAKTSNKHFSRYYTSP